MNDRPIVLLLHGILLNRWFLWPLERFLRSRGHRTLNLSYPSTRRTIEEHARSIADRIEREVERESAPRLHIVTHSLGGLVARRLLTHELPGRGTLPRAGRLVQLVPPNGGSAVARVWRGRRIYRALFGTGAGWQLGSDAEEIDRICGTPSEVEWGIVMGWAPCGIRASILGGPHDGVVSHAEMRMDPSIPTTTVEMGHTPLLFFPETWRQVSAFIARGCFLSPGESVE